MDAIQPALTKPIRTRLLTFALVVTGAQLCVPRATATTIAIDLGTSPNITSELTATFDTLNGTALQGQTLSLDFTFSDNKYVRLFNVTSDSFLALLTLQTPGSTPLDFLDGTGYLLNKRGSHLQQPQPLGRASGDGLMGATLSPLFSGELQRPVDFYGIHFDLTLPAISSISITGGKFSLISEPDAPFGVFVPDTGSSLLLLGLGSLLPLLAHGRRRQIS